MSVSLDYATPPPTRPKPGMSNIAVWLFIPVLLAIAGWFVGSVLTPRRVYSTSGILVVAGPRTALDPSIMSMHRAALTSQKFITSLATATAIPSSTLLANLSVRVLPGSRLIQVGYTATAKGSYAVSMAAMTLYCNQTAATSSPVTIFANPRFPSFSSASAVSRLGCFCAFIIGIIISVTLIRRWRQRGPATAPSN